MKIFLVDTESGIIEVLPESDLVDHFGEERLKEIKDNPNNTIRELPYTLRQYNRAVKLHEDTKWKEDFEEEYYYSPSLKDVLEHLYS
jgi:hypothetical protein